MGRSAKAAKSSTRQVRDSEATKAQILDAAEEEFAQYGLSGAKTEAIAARTGVTKAMLYYYYGSKESLYQAVIERPAIQLMEKVQQMPLDDMCPTEALVAFAKAAIAFEVAYPHRQALWFNEAVQNKGEYFKRYGGWGANFRSLFNLLERGMAEGSFRQMDIFLAGLMVIGVITFYFTTYENVKHLVPDRDLRSPEMVEKHTQEAIAFILAGIRNQPDPLQQD
ncbi:MAG: TetR/AcrR family transcriptional regulator [Microcoleus sp. SIO2G3]|nr:TetR/AcrR family transcriptional regulator [Microcoleus sp. SIO2G3]